jgi:hypothetical protein
MRACLLRKRVGTWLGSTAPRGCLSWSTPKGFCFRELFRHDLADGSIPHYGAKFDLLLCAGVLEFIVDLEHFASEVARLSP